MQKGAGGGARSEKARSRREIEAEANEGDGDLMSPDPPFGHARRRRCPGWVEREEGGGGGGGGGVRGRARGSRRLRLGCQFAFSPGHAGLTLPRLRPMRQRRPRRHLLAKF